MFQDSPCQFFLIIYLFIFSLALFSIPWLLSKSQCKVRSVRDFAGRLCGTHVEVRRFSSSWNCITVDCISLHVRVCTLEYVVCTHRTKLLPMCLTLYIYIYVYYIFSILRIRSVWLLWTYVYLYTCNVPVPRRVKLRIKKDATTRNSTKEEKAGIRERILFARCTDAPSARTE